MCGMKVSNPPRSINQSINSINVIIKPRWQDKSSKEYQRETWEALRKSINGLINKV